MGRDIPVNDQVSNDDMVSGWINPNTHTGALLCMLEFDAGTTAYRALGADDGELRYCQPKELRRDRAEEEKDGTQVAMPGIRVRALCSD
jgi:hypothetical protein